MTRIFLLSPAHCGGRRARLLLSEHARFDLACRLRSPEGAPLGELFAFLSGLYFRGKLAYAQRFARPPAGCPGAFVITPTEGLRPVDDPVSLGRLQAFAEVAIDAAEARYREPLRRDARWLAGAAGRSEVILLGSLATRKYLDVLIEAFGDQLRVPAAFVGRGDMSRGGLMLRCVAVGQELDYIPITGVLSGPPPPRLAPLP
jgi:hypothetical protein